MLGRIGGSAADSASANPAGLDTHAVDRLCQGAAPRDALMLCAGAARYLDDHQQPDAALVFLKRSLGPEFYCPDRLLIDETLRGRRLNPYQLEQAAPPEQASP